MTGPEAKTPLPDYPSAHPSRSFFGAFPSLGIWTPLGLGRLQFFAILAGAIALFTFFGGPAWRHVHDPHLLRITVSYAVIPFGVAVAYTYNRDRRVGLALVATAVIGLIKLVATAVLLMVFGLAAS